MKNKIEFIESNSFIGEHMTMRVNEKSYTLECRQHNDYIDHAILILKEEYGIEMKYYPMC